MTAFWIGALCVFAFSTAFTLALCRAAKLGDAAHDDALRELTDEDIRVIREALEPIAHYGRVVVFPKLDAQGNEIRH